MLVAVFSFSRAASGSMMARVLEADCCKGWPCDVVTADLDTGAPLDGTETTVCAGGAGEVDVDVAANSGGGT